MIDGSIPNILAEPGVQQHNVNVGLDVRHGSGVLEQLRCGPVFCFHIANELDKPSRAILSCYINSILEINKNICQEATRIN